MTVPKQALATSSSNSDTVRVWLSNASSDAEKVRVCVHSSVIGSIDKCQRFDASRIFQLHPGLR